MNDGLINDVRSILADIFSVSLDEVPINASPETIENWDSIMHVNLVLALEQRFSVLFDVEEIPKLISVEAIGETIQRKRT